MRVAVLCGGGSYERAISLRSGAAVEQAVRQLGHVPVMIDTGAGMSQELSSGNFDCAFIALHGTGGEDGSVQQVLELLSIPYTGSRPWPCEIAHDKVRAKRSLVAAGVATPACVALSAVAINEFGAGDVLPETTAQLGMPVVVKPVHGGSSLGVRMVRDAAELPRALVSALSWDSHVLVERYIAGRELSVAVLGTDQPICLPPVRIAPRAADHFDFDSRYTAGQTDLICPPRDLTEAEVQHVQQAALAAHQALDLSGWSRVDIMLDDAGVPWVLECNTVPGLTPTSLVPCAAAAAGRDVTDIVSELLDDALAQSRTDS
jgi:D-alanine-D-alanine ligase